MIDTILTIILKGLGLIPKPIASILSYILGFILFTLDKRHREVAINNLTIGFGKEKSRAQIKRIAIRVFKNLFMMIFEIGWSLWLDLKNFEKFFNIQGISNFKKASAKGKGVLLLSAHFGNWELMSILSEILEPKVNIIYQPIDIPAFNRFVIKIRSRFGAGLIPKLNSIRKILKSLKKGEAVAILIDQGVDWYEGVFVDFFGTRACTTNGMALISFKTGAPVIPLFLIREKFGFTLKIEPELPVVKTGDRRKDIEENTQIYNNVIEKYIREYPDQWFWVHNRWKKRPFQPINGNKK